MNNNSHIKAIGFDLFGVVVTDNPSGEKGIIKLITSLRKNGYQVGLLSNVDANYEFLHEYSELLGLFDRVLLSSQIGAAKPSLQAYEHLVVQLGTKPDETVFVDDSHDNVLAAKKYGLRGIFYKNHHQLEKDLNALGVKTD